MRKLIIESKKMKNPTTYYFLLMSILLFLVVGCSQNNDSTVLEPDLSGGPVIADAQSEISTFSFGPTDPEAPYPQSTSCIFEFSDRKQEYEANTFYLPNGSRVRIDKNALIPPAELFGTDVLITMRCDKDDLNNELIYSFGPTGCTFEPVIEVLLDWEDLGIGMPVLYYIDENGNYIEQQPDAINFRGKWMILNIQHFSRYAIGME